MTHQDYKLVAARAIAEGLPEAVSAADVDFITGPLVRNPQRVGGRLRNELAGIRTCTHPAPEHEHGE